MNKCTERKYYSIAESFIHAILAKENSDVYYQYLLEYFYDCDEDGEILDVVLSKL